MIYATDVSTYYVACKKQYFMYVAVPEIVLSDSVSVSVTAPTHSLSPSVFAVQVTAILLCNV